MTLKPDMLDFVGDGTRYTISCDYPRCSEHMHIGVLRPGIDPRLAAELTGWALDVDAPLVTGAKAAPGGWDYCPLHRFKPRGGASSPPPYDADTPRP